MTDKQQELHALLEETIDEQVKAKCSHIQSENANLRMEVDGLRDKLSDLEKTNRILKATNSDADTLIEVFEKFDKKLMHLQEKPQRANLVYKLLDALFVKDFDENTYECPTWLGAITNYYSNKELVIELLKVLKIDMPKNIHDFRLPIDWTEKELDMFFETIPMHVNCNGCSFSDNLRFWKPNCLDNVATMVNRQYSEIPWQFVLRNPLIKKEKYLKQIGEHAFKSGKTYRSSNWDKFFKLPDYQELSAEEKQIILDNMSNVDLTTLSSEELKNFILDNVELIKDEDFLTQIYKKYSDSYTFSYKNTLFKFPYSFIVRFIEENKLGCALEWLNRNREHFTAEQRKELLLLIMED